jgi:hypothetical protein
MAVFGAMLIAETELIFRTEDGKVAGRKESLSRMAQSASDR